MLKKETETLKEENKLKQDMSEKKILINNLTGKFNEERLKQMYHTETRCWRKYQSRLDNNFKYKLKQHFLKEN